MALKRTWKHDASEVDTRSPIEKKIDVFYHWVWGSQLHVADLMINGGKDHDGDKVVTAIPHAAFGALFILVNYFEMIAHYHAGTVAHKKPHQWFYEGVHLVFPKLNEWGHANVDSFLDTLYVKVRCGLYHTGRTRGGIGVWSEPETITYDFDKRVLLLNPHMLAKHIKGHFERYIARLEDPSETELRKKFESRFNEAERE
jgi:hypothetical protein